MGNFVSQTQLHTPNQDDALTDAYARRLTYLRLSITDVCNFRCDYCLPNGYDKKRPTDELSVDEIATLVRGFAELGTKKVRLTGGEPSLRRDLPAIIDTVANTNGIDKVCISTNGYRLGKQVQDWLEAGLSQINTSIDSFDPDVFAQITGHDILPKLLGDIDDVLTDGRAVIKINAILKAQHANATLSQALDYVRHRPVSFRFIEFMQTTDNSDLFFREHIRSQTLIDQLLDMGWQALPRRHTDGPAITYTHSDYAGTIGIIAPYAPTFCESCNRVRVNAQGKLHMCLFDSVNFDLREALQTNDTTALKQQLHTLIPAKPEHHFLHDDDSGLMHNLSLVGG